MREMLGASAAVLGCDVKLGKREREIAETKERDELVGGGGGLPSSRWSLFVLDSGRRPDARWMPEDF